MTVVCIDGPSGTGKSTAARRLAERLGYTYLDTGAIYRALAWLALDRNAEPEVVIPHFDYRVEGRSHFVGDRDVTEVIRTPAVTSHASLIAVVPEVRAAILPIQREASKQGNIVCEGRDMGTVVFPDAQVKFYLEATAEVRAHRRYLELQARGSPLTESQVLEEQRHRDERDVSRALSPLIPAEDAIHVDTSSLTLDQVVDILHQHVKERLS